ncbi:MAG: multidrug ABC transporter ATP-binding protein [Bacteroidetes bacterium RIFCSPLOWO2_12_FULL_31_6]|nr:MAG: multidrug ABC transporter ATP-binding protein [Bacteroidetes bacterium RIFCSPLOWO2_12_FULL_31_6]
MARKQKLDTEDLPKAKLNSDNLKKAFRIFQYGGVHRWKLQVGIIFLLFTIATALAFPYIIGKLIESANIHDLDAANTIAIYAGLILIAQSVCSFFRVYLFVNYTENALANLRLELYSHIVKLPMLFFSQKRVGELNSRISSDLTLLQETLTTTIAEFIRQFFIIIGGIGLLIYLSFKLTLFMLAVLPIVAIAAVIFGRFIRKISKEVQDNIAASNTIVEETMQGIANVKAFANEFFEMKRYEKSVQLVAQRAIVGGKYRGLFAAFIILCLFGAIVSMIWFGATLIIKGELDIAYLTSFVMYSIFVGASFGGIAELYAQIQKAVVATERVFEILEEATEELQTSGEIKVLNLKGEVKFDNIEFTYQSRKEMQVIKNISFGAKSGETVALVGPSGSGKSTMVSLLLRFYDPQKGSITIDGKNIKEYNLTELRNRMAIVPQDVLLFGGSIKENISYFKPNASMDEIIEAAKQANSHDFIMSFPEQYNTMVGERGVKLSGGQRQRIAIARAVLKNPSILILDEATSSLDSESERLVQQALEKLMVGRTTFVIAHRLSTIKNVDKIVVIDQGHLAEMGAHTDLIKNTEGIYYNLSKLQLQLN